MFVIHADFYAPTALFLFPYMILVMVIMTTLRQHDIDRARSLLSRYFSFQLSPSVVLRIALTCH